MMELKTEEKLDILLETFLRGTELTDQWKEEYFDFLDKPSTVQNVMLRALYSCFKEYGEL